MKLLWHPLAIADRECIMDFIARDKPSAALALDENFESHASRIEANPYLYRRGRVPGTREAVVHPNYVMVYRVHGETITIFRVLHAAQRWPSAE
ncbi:MAG: addiction module toxin, RelE/StbE family [Candidatus Accumulibacter adjunctus]|uniref:Addiction module toxin, RelE/StbE family n=1 Tax=Candidatus Accumulibacter adjunctus TaxID=1454001 RepID=A0A011NPL7_9PROT|nr:MAG: addiction module toxin, RelE/StbE family [Candidatus Accumulibacter adjunctus]